MLLRVSTRGLVEDQDAVGRCSVPLAGLIIVAARLMWPILFALRADGDIDCSWGIVWIPLWIFYSFGLMLSMTAVAQVSRQNTHGSSWEPGVAYATVRVTLTG